MTTDGGLRPMFHNKLREGAHWQAVETGAITLGIPDSNYCIEGDEGWVEFKKTSGWSLGFRPGQVPWHMTRWRRGGRSFIAIRRSHDGGPRKGAPVDELWLCGGRYSLMLEQHGLKCPDINWDGVWSGGPERWDWAAVRRRLAPTRAT
jgi:hypothetical protein